MARKCRHNAAHEIPEDADHRRVYCSTNCRVAAHRAAQAARSELLARMTQALASGADVAVIDGLRRQAEALLRR